MRCGRSGACDASAISQSADSGTFTPPFGDLKPTEETRVVRQIHASGADIVWVGISTPRQDLWMQRMMPKLNVGLMFGVGAAFDFNSGRVRLCPPWMKAAGLHWLHRLAQDPKRLWRRNVKNLAFLWHIALQLSGMREYRSERMAPSTENEACDRMAARTCRGVAAAAQEAPTTRSQPDPRIQV